MKQKLLNLKNSDKALFATSVLLLIFGIVLVIIPELSLKALCISAGVAALVFGIVKITAYITNKSDYSASLDLTVGAVFTGAGVLLLCHPKFLLSIIPFLIGVAIAVSGLVSLKKASGKGKASAKIIAVLTLIAGLIIIFNSFKASVAITRLIGLAIMICAVELFSETFNTAVKRREGKLKDENGYIEVDYKDVDE